MWYGTLEQLRSYLGYLTSETDDNSRLIEALNRTQKIIEQQAQRFFYPELTTKKFDWPESARKSYLGVYNPVDFARMMNSISGINQGTITLKEDLIHLYTLTNGDGSVVDSANIIIDPANFYPKNMITLTNGITWKKPSTGYVNNYKQAIQMFGLWCYHKDPDAMWLDTKDTLSQDIDLDDDTLYVGNVSGSDADRNTPRFQTGQVLCFGTSGSAMEMCEVLERDTTSNLLYVKRGFGKSTSRAHTAGTKLYSFQPWENIKAAHLRAATWWMRLHDTDSFDKQSPDSKTLPATLPKDVMQLLPARRIRF